MACAIAGFIAWLGLTSACSDELQVNHHGPRLLSWHLVADGGGQLPRMHLVFDEAIAQRDIDHVFEPHALGVSMLSWPQSPSGDASCSVDGNCPSGRCVGGRCFRDPLTAHDLISLAKGLPMAADLRGQMVDLAGRRVGPSAFEFFPQRALAREQPYELVFGGLVRDLQGAPFESDGAKSGVARLGFVTPSMAQASASSVAILYRVWPPPGHGHLLGAWRDVVIRAELPAAAVIAQRPTWVSSGLHVALTDPAPCTPMLVQATQHAAPANAATCLVWRMPALVHSGPWRLGLTDPLVSAATLLADGEEGELTWTPVADDSAPAALPWRARSRSGCLVFEATPREPTLVTIDWRADDGTFAAIGGLATWQGPVALAWRWPTLFDELAVGAQMQITWRNLAGTQVGEARTLLAPATVPPCALTILGVLANPSGPEPAQEIAVVKAFARCELMGIALHKNWEDRANLQSGGVDLPDRVVDAGQRVWLVGPHFDLAQAKAVGEVPMTLDEAALYRLPSALSLANDATRLALVAAGQEVLASATVELAAPSSQWLVQRDPAGCDIAGSWQVATTADWSWLGI